jgi:ADP-heptose:LPS heptosyltransferase
MKELQQPPGPLSAPFNTVEHEPAPEDLLLPKARPGLKLRRFFDRRVKPHLKTGIKRVVRGIMRVAVPLLPRATGLPANTQVKQVVIFGDMGIGNFVMLTPLLRALRRKFSSAEIVVVFIKGRGAELVAERISSIDRHVHIHGLRDGKFIDALPFLRTIRRLGLKPDLLVGRFSGSPYLPLMAVAKRPKWRVGHVSSAGFNGFCDSVYNFPVEMQMEEHEVERNLNIARTLGVSVEGCGLEFELAEEDIAEASAVVAAHGIHVEKLICLQMGSSEIQKWKRWPEASWSELIRLLIAEGFEICLLGSKLERALAERIAITVDAKVVNLCGSLTLGGTAAFIQLSRQLVSNDSGLMHIAAAVNTPIVGLFGPTEYDRTKPWTEKFIGLRGPCSCNSGTLFDRQTLKLIELCDRPCLTSTTPFEVLQAVHHFIKIEV